MLSQLVFPLSPKSEMTGGAGGIKSHTALKQQHTEGLVSKRPLQTHFIRVLTKQLKVDIIRSVKIIGLCRRVHKSLQNGMKQTLICS